MKQIFINIPASDLQRSMDFYAALGFKHHPRFTGDRQVCMAWSNDILLMLQSRAFFYAGPKKRSSGKSNKISASFTLPVASRTMMNKIMDKGLQAGGKEVKPLLDEGFMQVRTIEDPDGHIWGIIHLNLKKFKSVKEKSTSYGT